ncbi:MAG TPA: NAD(P)-dependent alcohol dehydrogenase [Candidatus Dormibacteraeota bacterium]|nr:NAD(P)-dependent alcohol dehydrogenase [Candidatus Dormibacteraeota bacterium]
MTEPRIGRGSESMKAIVCHTHGRPDALRIEEIDRPIVADDGVLIRVRATSINPVDFWPMSRAAYTARWLAGRFTAKAVVLGTDFAGIVESVGKNVTQFNVGDEVFGGRPGAFAEYISIPESGPVVRKRANVTFEQAAALPVAAVTALQAVRDRGRVKPGQRVLINGASGGVGSFALQIAKLLGAEVTAVCSPRNLDQARSLGADRVIDYTKEDYTQSAERYDVLVDIAGSHSWSENTKVLKPHGTFILAGASAYTVFGGNRAIMHIVRFRLASLFGSRRFAFFIAKLNKADLMVLGEFVSSGKLTAAIDRQYELSQAAEAMNYMGEGHAKGKIVVGVA